MLGQLIQLATRFLPRPLMHRIAATIGRTITLLYRGNRFEDPIDGQRYRSLLPYGRTMRRSNALAPCSLSLERHRLIWLYLSRQLHIGETPMRVLHMAPEWCLQNKLKAMANVCYTSADLESPWASVHCDIQCLPFDDNHFDLILCNHVLEHIPDDRKAMRELFRVLRPQGIALLLVPQDRSREHTLEDPSINTPALREKFYHQRDHLRLYGLDYAQRLSNEGFTVEIVDYFSQLPASERTRYALRPDDLLYIGHK
ncbi:MAG: class I SAM-dependent methyltransferase [Bacteroidia bacterium]|nr:class I SAM-dependent methyltransferase [Bacteroidia bacterium]